MNTKTIEQFNVISTDTLATVEGGFSDRDCVNAIFGTAITTAGAGFVGGMATFGVTSLPGAFVGFHVGAIAGGLVCVGGKIGSKFG
ncbi:TPA: Blp family class II bacteriocin [Streptococcus suis]|uniref:ABC-type iron transport system FetAB permease component n=1 Tax=Streptococcus parasuis TaxID=1501662 RepID=A0ABV2ERC6_9STRE|nr:Blp family class II bacteriocin [Streptococcus parasuis]MBY4971880.1 Blp family class II bacteriocin [Streptococcus suis]NQL69768.1 ComC/BlpC family leader-containing pheromone/bacteriocin [Streptococcus suis]NQN92398.1 ComC/BlpC family leader-containing pheromone/bacteriocin [Streptococcus suis]NQP59065.1 ComC/BlpC family leader-containing pheromone/bacteriocin [Streptococcus suis]BCP59796.1 hypothetical protein SUT286_11220 [Streptococcus parasuis]